MGRSAWIEDRAGQKRTRWKARYRGPEGRTHSRSFRRKVDAQRWLDNQVASQLRGEWVDPSLGRTLFTGWAKRWLGTKQKLKPTTYADYRSLLHVHVLPEFGALELGSIDRVRVVDWVAKLETSGLSASRIRKAKFVLSSILKEAVRSNYLARNAAEDIAVPRLPRPDGRYLAAEEVEALANAIEDAYSLLGYVLAYGGLRWGEATALRPMDCDLLRSRLIVERSVSDVGGRLAYGSTKNHGRRVVVLPAFLSNLIAERLSDLEHEDDLLFVAPRGGPLRHSNFLKRAWCPALRDARLEDANRPHDLRRTCASLLTSQGASPKMVKEHLGHSSISVTMDLYAHLFPSDTEALAEEMSMLRERAVRTLAPPSRPEPFESTEIAR